MDENFVDRIIQGDCRQVLPQLPKESVDLCVTSPPYYRLRDYPGGIAVWGGDENCQHEWGEPLRFSKGGGEGPTSKIDSKCKGKPGWRHFVTQSNYCGRCGAWRGQLGQEPSPAEYIDHLLAIFGEVKRVLKPGGTLWVVMGDTYAKRKYSDVKPKDLMGIPWRLAFALRDRLGFYLRSDIIWAKGISFCESYSGTCIPESVRDRPTSSYEHILMLARSSRYYYDRYAASEPARWPKKIKLGQTRGRRNLRSVWAVGLEPFGGQHFACFPTKLIEAILTAACPQKVCTRCGSPWVRKLSKPTYSAGEGFQGKFHNARGTKGYHMGASLRAKQKETGMHEPDFSPEFLGWQPTCDCNAKVDSGLVLDPFIGSGTTAVVAMQLERHFIGMEISPEYCKMARKRLEYVQLPLFQL